MNQIYTQMITFALALLGAALGLINTWKAVDRDRPKLLVRPSHAVVIRGGVASQSEINFSIEVINRSSFPLVITQIGFSLRRSSDVAAVLLPLTADGKGLPRKIDPRDAVSFYVQRPVQGPVIKVHQAYAKTACGLTFYGTSPALKQIIAAG